MKPIYLFLAMAVFALASCDNDDPYYPQMPPQQGENGGNNQGNQGNQGSDLNQYEDALCGSWISDDDPQSVFYLVLYEDRSGYYVTERAGEAAEGESFVWEADAQTLYVNFDGSNATEAMDYSFTDDHLYVDGIPLVVNYGTVPDVGVINSVFVGTWQGTIAGYYADIYALDEQSNSFSTIIEFANTGEGQQVDYDVAAPNDNYSYSPFYWQIDGDSIRIEYTPDNPNMTSALFGPCAATTTRLMAKATVEPYGAHVYDINMQAIEPVDFSPWMPQDAKATRATAGLNRFVKARLSGRTAVSRGTFAR